MSSCIPRPKTIPTGNIVENFGFIYPNRYSCPAKELWIKSPGNGSRPLPEIATDGRRNRNIIPLYLDAAPPPPRRKTTFSISFVVGAKETALEIVSASELVSRSPLCASNVLESPAT
ncbi:hypothetical protein AVEN_144214-1 [Araneus ventricosus]|uniref:Uncharacterized protein n=1 Tax=Araneus ventricosus TaxID=182803 RepID=A0A4Y2HTD6_ARAVE|nr:hypothetical protein AVEN_144214-1 [Araneus ventricosus]